MGILSLISGALKLVNAFLRMAERRELIDAGAAKNFRATIVENERIIVKARQAKRALRHTSDDVLRDPDRRDDE